MSSLTLFVVTHSEELFEGIPRFPYIRPILLGDLEIPIRFKGESLSENRLFLSQEALEVDTDFVGIVSARLEEREPGRADFKGFQELIDDMREDSFWSPRFRNISSQREIDFWIKAQDGIHPGMSKVLTTVKAGLYGANTEGRGVVANGNQFVVSRLEWLRFVDHWRRGLFLAEDRYGIDLPYAYRCWKCHKYHPQGYGRYTRKRHLGFFGERMTALHFAHSGLISPRGKNKALEERTPISEPFHWLLPIGSQLIEPYWIISGLLAKKCEVCGS